MSQALPMQATSSGEAWGRKWKGRLLYLFHIFECERVLSSPTLKEAFAYVNRAVFNRIEQGGPHISIFICCSFVWISTLAQQQERYVPGFTHAGEKQGCDLGKEMEGMSALPLSYLLIVLDLSDPA